MRLQLRVADVGGTLEVVTEQGELVEGLIGVQMEYPPSGEDRTTVTFRLFDRDVLMDDEAMKTREMRLSNSRPFGTDEEVHEHPTEPGNYGGSE